jgi:predicted nucleic acid-binding protein
VTTVFADTVYYLALLNPSDGAHGWAVAATEGRGARLVTTAYVLTEVADALSAPGDRPRFLALHDALMGAPGVTIVPASEGLFGRGVALYRARPDKSWSLTDCISFVVMADVGATEALTGDRHFRQAGFLALLVG